MLWSPLFGTGVTSTARTGLSVGFSVVNVGFTTGAVVVLIDRIGLSVREGVGWLDTGVKVLSTTIGTRV